MKTIIGGDLSVSLVSAAGAQTPVAELVGDLVYSRLCSYQQSEAAVRLRLSFPHVLTPPSSLRSCLPPFLPHLPRDAHACVGGRDAHNDWTVDRTAPHDEQTFGKKTKQHASPDTGHRTHANKPNQVLERRGHDPRSLPHGALRQVPAEGVAHDQGGAADGLRAHDQRLRGQGHRAGGAVRVGRER